MERDAKIRDLRLLPLLIEHPTSKAPGVSRGPYCISRSVSMGALPVSRTVFCCCQKGENRSVRGGVWPSLRTAFLLPSIGVAVQNKRAWGREKPPRHISLYSPKTPPKNCPPAPAQRPRAGGFRTAVFGLFSRMCKKLEISKNATFSGRKGEKVS